MQKLFNLLLAFGFNLLVSWSANASINDIVRTDAGNPADNLLLLTNITPNLSAAAYLHLRYFPSHDCSGNPSVETQAVEKVSPLIIKQRGLLKILGAAVYSMGAERVGDEGMARVNSIAVRLGARFGESNADEGYFYLPEFGKYTKSYCIRNVVCANKVCQSAEHFVPQVAFMMANKQPLDAEAGASERLVAALKFIDEYNRTEFAKQSTIVTW